MNVNQQFSIFSTPHQSIQPAEMASSRGWKWRRWWEERFCRSIQTRMRKNSNFSFNLDYFPSPLGLSCQIWGRWWWWWTQGYNWRQRACRWASRCQGRRCRRHEEHSVEPERTWHLSTKPNVLLTELNIAVRVRRVVIPIPTLPGTDSAGINRDSQPRTWIQGFVGRI